MMMHSGAWVIAKSIFLISNKQKRETYQLIADWFEVKAYGMVHWNIVNDSSQMHDIASKHDTYVTDSLYALLSLKLQNKEMMTKFTDNRILSLGKQTFHKTMSQTLHAFNLLCGQENFFVCKTNSMKTQHNQQERNSYLYKDCMKLKGQ